MNKGRCRHPICEEAKQEVAREIFEKINGIFREYYNICSKPTGMQLKELLQQGERFVINEMWHDIAELKKKYLEEKHEKV